MPQGWIDQMGGAASALCALHCATLSIAPALLAAMGVGFLADHLFEWGLFAASLVLGGVAGVLAIRRRQAPLILAGFEFGIVGLVVGRMAEIFHWFEGAGWIGIVGAAALLVSHFANLRAPRVAHP